MQRLLVIMLALVLGACASTGVIPMDRDSFVIVKKRGAPGIGMPLEVKAEVYAEANQFCTAKNKQVNTIQVDMMPAMPGQLGQVSLQFTCIDRGLSAQPLQRGADTIVEIRNR
jgi:hypothetical protein